MIVPFLCLQPPFSLIDDTKVQEFSTNAKDRKLNLLNGFWGLLRRKKHKLEKKDLFKPFLGQIYIVFFATFE
jgi:hypothetical protein